MPGTGDVTGKTASAAQRRAFSRARGNVSRARRRVFRGALWGLALLLVAGGVWRCAALRDANSPVLWEVAFPGELNSPQVQLRPGEGVVAGGWRATAWISERGRIEQFIPMPPNTGRSAERSQSNHLDAAGNLYFTLRDELLSYDPHGNLRWQITLPPQCVPYQGKPSKGSVSRVSPEDHVLVVGQSMGLVVLNTDGEVLAQPKLGFEPAHATPLELPDGCYALGMTAPAHGPTEVAVVDGAGAEVWRQSLPGVRLRQLEAYAGGVLAQDMAGQTWLLESGTGEVRWHYQPPLAQQQQNYWTETSSCVLTGDGALLLCSVAEVACLDSAGQVRWRFRGAGLTGVAPLAGDACYVITYQDRPPNLLASFLMRYNQQAAIRYHGERLNPRLLKLEHGQLVQEWPLPTAPTTISGPGPDGEVYIYSLFNDRLYCIQPE